MKKYHQITIVLVIAFYSYSFGQSSITIDHIDGEISPGVVNIYNDITFYFRMTNNSGFSIVGSTNGFEIYSPDNAVWDTIIPEFTNSNYVTIYDSLIFINQFSSREPSYDTIGFGGFDIPIGGEPPEQIGIPTGFNEVFAKMTIQFSSGNENKHICIDSAFYRSGGNWVWSYIRPTNGDLRASWSGPFCYELTNIPTAVHEISPVDLPKQFKLHQNSPNPFNASTRIEFDLPQVTDFNLSIFNITGQLVKSFSSERAKGSQSIIWDASSVASGVYLYRLSAGEFQDVKRMVLIK